MMPPLEISTNPCPVHEVSPAGDEVQPSPKGDARERPILFSAPMVRALLAGTKTQTRRVVKLPHNNRLGQWEVLPWGGPNGGRTRGGEMVPFQNVIGHSRTGDIVGCPYGQPGDRLWVRETFFAWGRWESRFSSKKNRDEWHFVDETLVSGHAYRYAADGLWPIAARPRLAGAKPSWWQRPAIYMPRVASRIALEVSGVRVERLQDISEKDALAEGIEHFVPDDPRKEYRLLWEDINGAGSWGANPCVWVVEFRRIAP
jgi:hypothetical protein